MSLQHTYLVAQLEVSDEDRHLGAGHEQHHHHQEQEAEDVVDLYTGCICVYNVV